MKSRNVKAKICHPVYLDAKYSRQLKALARVTGLPVTVIARSMVQRQIDETIDALTTVETPQGSLITRVG